MTINNDGRYTSKDLEGEFGPLTFADLLLSFRRRSLTGFQASSA